jgi:hypothetical protein
MSPSAKDQVFISYSHEDTKWREDAGDLTAFAGLEMQQS